MIGSWSRTAAGPRVGGHRGAARRAPENTLAGVRLAIDASVDYVELDVHLARDGVLVVIHDEDLGRTTDGVGLVADRTSEDLMALDAGAWAGATHAGERLPCLAEVLDLLETRRTPQGRRIGAVIEAKGRGTGAPLARVIQEAPGRDRLAICSFSPRELLAARAIAPDIPTMLIVDRDDPDADAVPAARACGAAIVNIPAAWLSRPGVDRLHGAGLLVAGGTCDDEETMRHCVAVGLDAVDSNVPDLAVMWRAAAVGERARG